MARACPDCQTLLQQETYQDVTLDVCPQCAGIWFDEGELRTLLATDTVAMIALEDRFVPQIEPRPTPAPVRLCPNCATPLEPYHYLYDSPIELDACPDCGGFWVQDGELAKMQEWHDKVTAPQPRQAKEEIALVDAAIETAHTEQKIAQKESLFALLQRRSLPWFKP